LAFNIWRLAFRGSKLPALLFKTPPPKDSSTAAPPNVERQTPNAKRQTPNAKRQIAQGPLEEYRYYLILVQDLGYDTTANIEAVLEEVSKLLIAYASAIESNC
jgi:hypothetical protein